MLELIVLAMFVMQCFLFLAACCYMMPKRQRKSSESAGSSFDDEVAEESLHVPMSAKKHMHLAKRLRKGKSGATSDAREAEDPAFVAGPSSSHDARDPAPPNDVPAQITDASVPEPPVVDQVRDYFTTKSGKAFHLGDCQVIRYRLKDATMWNMCHLCFPSTRPKREHLAAIEGVLHSTKTRCTMIPNFAGV